MRITHISDTHNKHKRLTELLPGGDLLIHSGDFTSIGREEEVERFVDWFNSIDNYKAKVFIAGNHDLTFESEIIFRTKSQYFDGKTYNDIPSIGKPQWLEVLLGSGLNSNVFYLENQSITIDNVNIWGSPYSPSFGYGWAFNKNRGYDIAQCWNEIPMGTHIVITHTPIYGCNDRVDYQNVGCADLYYRVKEVKPHLHFAGHIHEGYGWKTIGLQDWYDLHTFNGCSCNLRYEVENKPITFDYNFESGEINFI